MNLELAQEIASTAVHRKDLEVDRPIHEGWEELLVNCIFLAHQAGPSETRRRMALADKVDHPEKGTKITVGEALALFGLVQDINNGVVWNDG